MKITLDASVLNGRILKPISRVVEDCILTITDSMIDCIATVPSRGIIIYTSYPVDTDITEPCNLNIKDISKLSSVLNCVGKQELTMEITSNAIKYTSDDFKFKFHLKEDGVILSPKLSKKRLDKFTYNCESDLNVKIFYDILKASSFIKSDDVKIYFYTLNSDDEVGLYCDITNKLIMNSDSITIKLSDSYDGVDINKDLICDIEHIRKMNIQKDSNIYLYFNSDTGFTIFDLIDESGRIRYILPSLSK